MRPMSSVETYQVPCPVCRREVDAHVMADGPPVGELVLGWDADCDCWRVAPDRYQVQLEEAVEWLGL